MDIGIIGISGGRVPGMFWALVTDCVAKIKVTGIRTGQMHLTGRAIPHPVRAIPHRERDDGRTCLQRSFHRLAFLS